MILSRLVLAVAAAAYGCAPAQTWTGTISDAMCGTYHEWDEHTAVMTEKDCTLKCVKDGAKYVLLTEGRIHPIINQDHPGLAEHAGTAVEVSGRSSDEGITVRDVRKQ
jgi:hypothetical protein